MSFPHRDDVDGVKAHIELAQPRGDRRHRQSGRRLRLDLMPTRRCVCQLIQGDHRDQLALVLAHPDDVAAKAAPVIDRGRASRAQRRLRSGDESPMPADASHTHLASADATVIPR